MTVTSAYLMDEKECARFLKVGVAALRKLRQHGHGPSWFTLPTGQIRYLQEDAEAWMKASSTTLHVDPASNVVALPGSGMRVRVRLPKLTPGSKLPWRNRRNMKDGTS